MRIGVTGTYASGKGTVCSLFAEFGGVEVDTDIIARKIAEKEQPGYKAIITHFGNSFLNEDATLNRRKLANYVFTSEKRTKELNDLLHPIILSITLSESEGTDVLYFINAPLLFEAGFDKHMDYSILVTAQQNQSVERGKLRDNLSEEEILLRINQQFSINKKMQMADYIIDNSGTLAETKTQVAELWKTLISLKTNPGR